MLTTLPLLSRIVFLYQLALLLLKLPSASQVQYVSASPLSQQIDKSISGPLTRYALDSRALTLGVNYITPSTNELLALIDRNTNFMPGRKPSVFWTSLYIPNNPGGAYIKTRQWAAQKFGARCNYLMYSDMFDNADYLQLKGPANPRTPAEDDIFTAHCSRAFASRTMGTVYVMMSEGTQPNPNSVWAIWEAPQLTRMPKGWVDQIIRVDYPSGVETVIWRQGDNPLYNAPPQE